MQSIMKAKQNTEGISDGGPKKKKGKKRENKLRRGALLFGTDQGKKSVRAKSVGDFFLDVRSERMKRKKN